MAMVAVSSWGRLSRDQHTVVALRDRAAVPASLARQQRPAIAHGMGRSYGDQALNPRGTLWSTRGLNRFICFDENTGVIECEAGVLLREIQQLAAPRGWMLPVTPGSWWVTVGGAIANDVHGKNHHRQGTFGEHVAGLRLVRSDGSELQCSGGENADWFAATLGGMGLTGLVTSAVLQLRRVEGQWLDVETLPYASLGEFFQLADESQAGWEYTVSWVDCLSGTDTRGIFMRGNHTHRGGLPRSAHGAPGVPFAPPVSLVNRFTLKALNALYYRLHRRRAGRNLQHYVPFFYPLDGIGDWNRIYGPRGFYQYQCVLPTRDREASTAALLEEIRKSGEGSFLAVLKTFAERSSPGLLSFPMPGVTLALDFPNRGASTLALMARLDAVVAEAGGRLYAAKDARMPRELFAAGYPHLGAFLPFRDPGMSSALSRRLLDEQVRV